MWTLFITGLWGVSLTPEEASKDGVKLHRETLVETGIRVVKCVDCGQMLVNLAAGAMIPRTRAEVTHEWFKEPVCGL